MSINSLSIGIIGLPNVGKSTLFNALLKRQAALAANYPFATIEPNIGVVDVPDARLNRLAEIVRTDFGARNGDRELPEKIIPTTIKFYDIAGLVKGASKGEGLGNAFLGHIREVDALVHLVRDFNDDNVIRAGSVTPEEDISIINTELILSDLQVLEKRLQKAESDARGDKSDKVQRTLVILKKIKETLDQGTVASELSLEDSDKELIKDLNLLTLKPVIYVYNTDESQAGNNSVLTSNISQNNKLYISAKIESEIASIENPEERNEFLKELGIQESGLDRIIKKGYEILGLQSFLTMGPKEVRAWTILKGMTAPQAAGRIHTDFERGFISAEVISYADVDRVGSEKKARELGLVRLEGKIYVMKDGDVVEFRFSV